MLYTKVTSRALATFPLHYLNFELAISHAFLHISSSYSIFFFFHSFLLLDVLCRTGTGTGTFRRVSLS